MARMVTTGVDLYVEEGGSDGPTLLLLHGLGGTGDVWSGMLPLIQKDWKGRWLIPDFRGHGRSGHRGPYCVASHAADVASLVHDKDEEIVVAGHSMGGLVALALATQCFGIRVQRVAAFGVKMEWTHGEIAKFRQLSEAAVRWFESETEAVDRYLKVSGLAGLVAAGSPVARSGVCGQVGRYRLAADPRTYDVVGSNAESFIAAARAPFRLAAGSKDQMVTLSNMISYDTQPVVFGGLGHNAHVEDPETVWAFINGG
jgi:pimeloyl-ACP methyl ester carboxylesterase